MSSVAAAHGMLDRSSWRGHTAALMAFYSENMLLSLGQLTLEF